MGSVTNGGVEDFLLRMSTACFVSVKLSNFFLRVSLTLVCARTGSSKTTFVYSPENVLQPRLHGRRRRMSPPYMSTEQVDYWTCLRVYAGEQLACRPASTELYLVSERRNFLGISLLGTSLLGTSLPNTRLQPLNIKCW